MGNNVKSLNALSLKLGKESEATSKVNALKNVYAALGGTESIATTVAEAIDEIVSVAEKPTKQEVVWKSGTVSNEVTKVSIPEGVTKIAAGGFLGCSNLTSVTIPDTVMSIDGNAFNGCTNLTSVDIPDGVASIRISTFQSCSALTSVTIPNTVTSIEMHAFGACKNLANIYFKGTEEQWDAITKDNSWNGGMGSSVSGGTVISYNCAD